MAERPSWAVSAAGGLITVEDARAVVSGAIFTPGGSLVTDSRSGWLPGPAGISQAQVTATSPTPNGFVHVAAFHRVQQSTRGKGSYIMCLDTTKDINILSTPAHATNQRNDLIVAQQNDAFYGDGDSVMTVRHVVGTPAGSPADPAVSGSPDYVILARVRVPANATSIVSGNIDNLRPIAISTGIGGVLPVANQAERDAITSPYTGLTVWRTDAFFTETYTGSGWRADSNPSVTAFADLATYISAPYTGMLAYVVNDGALYRYTGSAWLLVSYMLGGLSNCRWRATSAQTITNNNDTKARFHQNTESSSIVTASLTDNQDFALNRTGLWLITASVRFSGNVNLGERNVCIVKSTDVVGTRYAQQSAFPSASNACPLSVSTTRRFTSGDKISILLFQNSGVSIATDFTFGEAFYVSFVWLGP